LHLINVQSQLFRTVLRGTLGWELGDVAEEDGPTVVDTEEAAF
jgi:hypothetical protein